jgi:hypothetical protein
MRFHIHDYSRSCVCLFDQWDWHSYILNGQRQPNFAESCPKTAQCLDDIAKDGHLFDSTPFSFAFFSTLHGDAAIKVMSARAAVVHFQYDLI